LLSEININQFKLQVMDTSKSRKVGEILRTKDYSIFKVHKFNRTINDSNVNNIYKSMLNEGWVEGSIVVVNGRGDIIDGQHRILAAMKANVPVHYTVNVKTNYDSIPKLNMNKKLWNIIDHLQTYVKKENQNYILLDRFMKNFPDLRPTECMMLVKNTISSTKRGEFESGEFKVKDMKLGYQWGHNIMSLKPYFEDGYDKSIFVRAMVRVMLIPTFNFDEFLHKVKLRPRMMVKCGTVEQYMKMIEDIYNYRRNNNEKIRF
jgi:hypothetical protein